MYKTTASTNIKSFKKGGSYSKLKSLHFDIDNRYEKGISKDKNLENLNKHFSFYSVENMLKKFEEYIQDYNNKPSQKKNPNRCYKNLADYVAKRQARKNVNPDFHGINFMMVSKISNLEDWEEIINTFGSHSINEKDTLESLNNAFLSYGNWFNDEFKECGLVISEMDTNLDEHGSPHCHANLMNFNIGKNKLPDTNIATSLTSRYGKNLTNKELLSKFREEIDSKLLELSSKSLLKLAKDRGFKNFSGIEFIRTNSNVTGLDHETYKLTKELERNTSKLSTMEHKYEAFDLEIRMKKRTLSSLEEEENTLQSNIQDLKEEKRSITSSNELLKEDGVRLAREVKTLEKILLDASELNLEGISVEDFQKYALKRTKPNTHTFLNQLFKGYHEQKAKDEKMRKNLELRTQRLRDQAEYIESMNNHSELEF